MDPLAWAALACLPFAALPALVFLGNLRAYRPPPAPSGRLPSVSVLIPARNEEKAIAEAIGAALAAAGGIEVEIVALDDGSTDRTPEIVRGLARADSRVRLEQAPPLPAGWCGKQHACHVLASRARHDLLLFQDADVRLEHKAIGRLAGFLRDSEADLVSGVPRQQTGTILEMILIPMIHFVLLGFLPVSRMRQSRSPAFSAGCGQLFLATREGYERAGGHAAIRETLHDGIRLPRAFRRAGLATDLCDATPLARCRMYEGAMATWKGLGKNATEGLGSPGMIVPATIFLLAGQVAPFAIMAAAVAQGSPWPALALSGAGMALAWLPRFTAAIAYRQSPLGALLHPCGVILLLVIQWQAMVRKQLGLGSSWRGRTYPA
jgi:hypothetical protein